DRREVLVGEGLARAVPACGAEVELGRRDLEVGAREGCVEDGEALLDHFGSDAVAAHDGELHTLRHAVHPTPRPTCRTPGLGLRTRHVRARPTADDGAPGTAPGPRTTTAPRGHARETSDAPTLAGRGVREDQWSARAPSPIRAA